MPSLIPKKPKKKAKASDVALSLSESSSSESDSDESSSSSSDFDDKMNAMQEKKEITNSTVDSQLFQFLVKGQLPFSGDLEKVGKRQKKWWDQLSLRNSKRILPLLSAERMDKVVKIFIAV